MSQAIQLRNADNLPDIADPLSLYDRPGEQSGAVFRKLHRLLRNRYKWCVLLSVLGLSLGAFAGFKLSKQIYISRGMIHIKPVLPVVIRQTPENSPMGQFFDLFMQGQASFIKTQRVIDMALASDEWQAMKRPADDEMLESFLDNLNVLAPKGEVIVVSFTDPDPKAAVAAVKSVLTAYNRIHVEGETRQEDEKRQTLEKRRLSLMDEIRNKQDAINLIAKQYGTDDLRSLLDAKFQSLNRWEANLAELDFELAGIQGAKPDDKKTAIDNMTVTEIAMRDPGMRLLLEKQETIKSDLATRSHVLGENHPKVQELRAMLAAKEQAVQQYATEYRTAAKTMGMPGANVAALMPEQIRAKRAKYAEIIQTAKTESNEMGNRMLEIDKLRKEQDLLGVQLEQIKKRLDELNIEPQGRIRVVSFGDRPMPYKDSRIVRSVAGGIGGGMFGFGIVLLIGLLDRRFRSAEDARSSVGRLTLLGVLPSLPDDLADPEQAAIAAHCVHQIRTLLQINSPVPGARVFAITSPAAGTGKTSLALALGVSFAAANSRTLLIDCDIVGGGLTARVDTIIRRKIGQILKRQGLITQQQLDMAMKVAANSHRRLGEILVDLGFLTEPDIARALTLQEELPVGMLDALDGESIENCVADTGIRGLEILPLGAAMPSDAGRLSPNAVRKLIDEARKRYDTVLVDTGPVPGSLEASVVAAASDGVVLVVSRGEHRPLAERSLQHLHGIGAVVSGMVFNRAESRDVDLSTTTNRLSSFDRTGRTATVRVSEVVEGAEPQKFGPIAMAVTGRAQPGKNGSRP